MLLYINYIPSTGKKSVFMIKQMSIYDINDFIHDSSTVRTVLLGGYAEKQSYAELFYVVRLNNININSFQD